LVHGNPSEIPVLNQEPTDHPSQIKSSLGKGRGERWGLKKAKILLRLKDFERLRIKSGSNDRLKKNLNHLLSGLLINDLVKSDHSTKGRHRIAISRLAIRIHQIFRGYGHPAGIIMLDDNSGRLFVFLYGLIGGVQIQDVIK
jgi:hypothetical protein